jgi:multidrug resistance efflux pump
LVQIVAPELDHQIAQAEATLKQLEATVQQAQANRDLAEVTWHRDSGLVDKGWVTPQQGDTDRLTLQAHEAGVGITQAISRRPTSEWLPHSASLPSGISTSAAWC